METGYSVENAPTPEREMPYHYAGVLLVTPDGRLIGQLRDDIPGIDNPGKVATFGGAVEDNEDFRRAAWRELVLEETNLQLTEEDLILFHEDGSWREPVAHWQMRHIYVAQISYEDLEKLEVYEGQGWREIIDENDTLLVENWRTIIEQFRQIQAG